MSRILITGSRGFLGSRIINTYNNSHNILATNSGNLDITDRISVNNAVSSYKPDYVIHAAAVAVTDYCNSNPELCYRINVTGTVNIAEACQANGCRLIFLSTEQVFNGNQEAGPYNEEVLPMPDTVYGRNKLEAEKFIFNISDDYLILRLTWLFGIPGKDQPVSGNILWDTIKNMMTGRPFRVPANEYRGMTSIDELLARLPFLLRLPTGLYHTGSVNHLSRYDTVCHIIREMGLQDRIPELIIKDTETYSQNARDARLDTAYLKSYGVRFTETPEAISRYIRENHLSV